MQINRLFEMIYILLNKQTMTAKAFAEHFEVSQRTVYRDVELLSAAGIPIYMTKGRGGGIALLPDFVLNKTVLTDGEKADILSALHAVDSVSLDRANTAIGKLSSMFGGDGSDWVEVDFSGWANAQEEAAVFAALKTAILQKRRATLLYHSGKGSVRRIVEPLKLYFKGQSWYLYAYCTLRGDCRFFKLRRIKELSLLEEHFIRTAPAKLLEEETGFREEMVTLTLHIEKEMAYRVYDELPQWDIQPDGSFMAQLTMPRGEWVYQYLATFGEHGEVVAPEDIRRDVKETLQNALKKYV